MIRLILSIILLCSVAMVRADYRIVFLNTPSIRINGREMKVNDTFPPVSTVEWKSEKQAMKIADTKTGEQKLLVASQYQKSKARNVQSYLSGVKHLSSRGVGAASVPALSALLNDHFFYTDSLSIETGIPTDGNRFFYVSYIYNGEEINKMVPNDNGRFVITNDIFTIDGIRIPPFETVISVYYIDETKDTVTLVCDSMLITPIPESL